MLRRPLAHLTRANRAYLNHDTKSGVPSAHLRFVSHLQFPNQPNRENNTLKFSTIPSRKHQITLATLVVLLVSALTAGMLFAANEQHQPDPNVSPAPAPEHALVPQEDAQIQVDLPPINKEPPLYPNLDSNLNQLVEDSTVIQKRTSTDDNTTSPATDPVLVTFYVEPNHIDAMHEYLDSNGIFIRNAGEDYIEAHVPPALLPAASTQPGVLRVDTVIPLQPDQIRELVISQGVNLHGADAWHSAGYRGNNVKVGIIDTSFDGFSQRQGNELPLNVTARCYFDGPKPPSSNLADCEANGITHGTDVAETLIDVAPNALLYIANLHSKGDLRDAVDWMAEQGVEIINFSAGAVPDGPGDGTSPFSNSPLRTIDAAVATGITWVNAGGNHALNVWYGTFSDTNQDGVHNFTPQDQGNYFFLPTNSKIVAFMRWDDSWGQANCDLDLFLVRYNDLNSEWVLVAADIRIQDGNQGSIPLAALVIDQANAGEYQLGIQKDALPQQPCMDTTHCMDRRRPAILFSRTPHGQPCKKAGTQECWR